MPIYCYKCDCGHVTEDFRSKPEPLDMVFCEDCGHEATRSISYEHVHSDMVHNSRWSESMGVTVEQIPEAMRTFPGSEYHPETGALRIDSRKDKIKKMKERGYVEY